MAWRSVGSIYVCVFRKCRCAGCGVSRFFSVSDVLEPPAEGRGIGFPQKHAILADCTVTIGAQVIGYLAYSYKPTPYIPTLPPEPTYHTYTTNLLLCGAVASSGDRIFYALRHVLSKWFVLNLIVSKAS